MVIRPIPNKYSCKLFSHLFLSSSPQQPETAGNTGDLRGAGSRFRCQCRHVSTVDYALHRFALLRSCRWDGGWMHSARHRATNLQTQLGTPQSSVSHVTHLLLLDQIPNYTKSLIRSSDFISTKALILEGSLLVILCPHSMFLSERLTDENHNAPWKFF